MHKSLAGARVAPGDALPLHRIGGQAVTTGADMQAKCINAEGGSTAGGCA